MFSRVVFYVTINKERKFNEKYGTDFELIYRQSKDKP
jgi:hypothetical protein